MAQTAMHLYPPFFFPSSDNKTSKIYEGRDSVRTICSKILPNGSRKESGNPAMNRKVMLSDPMAVLRLNRLAAFLMRVAGKLAKPWWLPSCRASSLAVFSACQLAAASMGSSACHCCTQSCRASLAMSSGWVLPALVRAIGCCAAFSALVHLCAGPPPWPRAD